MSNIYQDRLDQAYKDIRGSKSTGFHLPLNKILHEVKGDFNALAAAGVDVEEFKNMHALGFAKHTLLMTGENLHPVFRQVIHSRCENLLTGCGKHRLHPDVSEQIAHRKQDLESRYSDLTCS